jgi:hypothetical protein
VAEVEKLYRLKCPQGGDEANDSGRRYVARNGFIDVPFDVAMRLTNGVAGFSMIGRTPAEFTVEMETEFLDKVHAALDAAGFAGKATPEIVAKIIVAIANRETPILPTVLA